MSALSSFAQHVVDLLSGVGPVKVRAMFGGYGVSLDGASIGLIAEDRLYLRVDDVTRAEFETAGSMAFVYPSRKGPMTMKSYWSIPESALDDAEEAVEWGRRALRAAQRAEVSKKSKKPGPARTNKPKRRR